MLPPRFQCVPVKNRKAGEFLRADRHFWKPAGRGGEALSVLKENLVKHPNDRDTLFALTTFSRDAGDADAALAYAERLAALTPNDRDLARLVDDLKQRAKKPDAP